MVINISHLGYKIYVRNIKTPPAEIPHAIAYVENIDNHSSAIYLDFKQLKRLDYFPNIAHEVTHILQNICFSRDMEFTKETEHMGYLMSYILNEILGYKYDTK